MSLESMQFDRFLFRKKSTDASSVMQGVDASQNIGGSYSESDYAGGSGSAGGGMSGGADNGIMGIPGGIIAQMYLRSSNTQDRVEINPNDQFIAYNNNVPVVTIDKNGINKYGFPLPTVLGVGFVNAAGTAGGVFPTGWTVTNLSAGRYEITHNLNSTNYVVLLTPLAATTREFSVESQTLNTFITRFYTNAGSTLIDTDHSFIVLTNP